ncbi:hypothetical protein K2173_018563 [Erythroxylum novogranatense]|uniref:UMP kinase n=1 Tax=Erythroxylum novogranatense TaxID=1862640 RepID=A0AAV8UC52_9ROSI|nr:hypothetical protein K2173_018563 [Erythroxylum novogranatense]
MASCDDDFSLIGDDNHHQTDNHHHILHTYAPHRFSTKSSPIHAPPLGVLPTSNAVGSGTSTSNFGADGEEQQQQLEEEEEADENVDNEIDSAFPDVNPFNDSSNPFNNDANLRTVKKSDGDDHGRGGKHNDTNSNNYQYMCKRPKTSGNGGGECRKDREEWSDSAIACLLDAYMDKYAQLNRGNLRGRDWEEVAATASQRCGKLTKTVEQCKNKVDNLKKRYKLEKHRMSSSSNLISHWPWFKQMEEIVGNMMPVKAASDEYKVADSPGIVVKQPNKMITTTATPVFQNNSLKPKSVANSRWKRVVLKISGVALAGTGPNNTDPKVMMLIAREIAMACQMGVEVAIIVGGRNLFCRDTWVTATGSDRRTTYQIGMMASVMNSLLLQSTFEKTGVQTRVQTVFAMQEGTEAYSRQRAIRHLEKGRVVIFGGIGAGTGNPLFSTDTAAALQAFEINAEAVLKGTNVDGVYDCHSRDSNVTFEHISFRDLVSRGATSMDMMALTFCEENHIPVVVFNLLQPGNISKALCGEQVGTLIDQTGRIS